MSNEVAVGGIYYNKETFEAITVLEDTGTHFRYDIEEGEGEGVIRNDFFWDVFAEESYE